MEYWYFITGPKHHVDLHMTHMQGVDLFIPGTTANGQTFQQKIKMGFEPIHLCRAVFPREATNAVLARIGQPNKKGFLLNTAGSLLKKSLGLKDIPPIVPIPDQAQIPVTTDYCHIIPLGMKDDGPDRIMGATGVKQEPL